MDKDQQIAELTMRLDQYRQQLSNAVDAFITAQTKLVILQRQPTPSPVQVVRRGRKANGQGKVAAVLSSSAASAAPERGAQGSAG